MRIQKKMSLKKQGLLKKLFLIAGFAAITTCSIPKTAKAFVPYIYEPNAKMLKNTSLGIGQTAAKLLQLGQYKEAKRLAALAVRINSKDDRLWSLLAEAQIRNGENKEAKRSLANAKQINPKEARIWFREADIELREKNITYAIQLLKEGLKIQPKNATAYFTLGNARIMESNYSLALNAFKQATKFKPDFWQALNNQGLILFEMGSTNQAISIWKQVLKLSQDAEPMLALASALNFLEPGSKEALELANKSLDQNPNYVSEWYQEEQLWGKRLREATTKLFKNSELDEAVTRAIANSESRKTKK